MLYQDDHLLIVDKAPGLLTVPGRLPENKHSLQTLLLEKFPNSRIVHRLDQPTSGLLIIPQSQAALSHIAKQFQNRLIDKRYQAIAQGQILETRGEINQPLMCDWPNRPKQMVHADGKPSITHYKVMGYNKTSNATRVTLYPVTGRSHQLRVHLQFIGHPILGDDLYAEKSTASKTKSLMLHAEQITFQHPKSGVQMTFTRPARHWPETI